MRRWILSLALLSALSLFCRSAGATTVVLVADEGLVDRTHFVVSGTVEARAGVLLGGRIHTDYRLRVERSLKGGLAVGASLPVRVLGGVAPDGSSLKIWGAPEMAVGDRALLFLDRHADGTYRPFQLVQGHFLEATVGGRHVWVRDLAEVGVLGDKGIADGAEGGVGRDFARFPAWIAGRAAGRATPADYRVEVDPRALRMELDKFTYIAGDVRVRWFEFDRGASVSWRADDSGQRNLDGGGFAEFQTAIQAWNADPATNIRYRYDGPIASHAGFVRNGLNAIYFADYGDDIDGDFPCPGGGTLAVGGPFASGRPPGPNPIAEADIVVNNGAECFFGSNSRRAEEVYAHELGHTLGLGHSCGDADSGPCDTAAKDDALMRANTHGDGRGARLGDDDRAAILTLYPEPAGGGGGGAARPAAPGNLVLAVVSASSIRLTWQDNADNETSYRVERKTGTGAFQEIKVLAANAVTFTVTGLSPATTYAFRVRARNAGGASAYSSTVTLTTVAGAPAAPSNLVATPLSSTAIKLDFRDNSNDESGFEIEVSSPEAAFASVARVSFDTNSYVVGHLLPGHPYTFRVHALSPGGRSADSSPVSAATARPAAGPCAASAATLCLGGGRLAVDVFWRTPAGQHGAGTAVPSSEQTGLFWFFDSANVELIVKVLDGTSVNGFYWTFYGGLSDVEYWITVTDTRTGEAKTYHNPAGSFCGSADTSSLVVTPAAATAAAATPAKAAPAVASTEPLAFAKAACTPSAGTLCLLGGRFAVSVDFERSGQAAAAGTAVPLAGDQSGLFWFFDPGNLELVVKVIDGRPLNGKLWFFYGALSDVRYTLRVTDTATGAEKTYNNLPGNLCGQADTAAFSS